MRSDTWKVFSLLKKCRKLTRSLEKDGFPETGKQRLLGIEQRLKEFRKRLKELEQLLRTRELDLPHADAELRKIQKFLSAALSDDEQTSLRTSLQHAARHREHIIEVMRSRNLYVLRLDELYHHVRQLHSHLMMVDSPAPDETTDIVAEIDALVESVDAVDVVRKEVQATLEQRRAHAASRIGSVKK